jgi:G:T-mismatch repair DNA endonuclease (very short patch repair protein)
MAFKWGEIEAGKGGCFWEKENGHLFEFELENDGYWEEYGHKVWVAEKKNIIDGVECGWRYAKVLKTVAYIVVDEDEYGAPVVEKWDIKGHKIYG